MFYLYKITNLLSRKVYIGQSIKETARWRQHKYFSRQEKPLQYIHCAMAKYGVENFTYEVIVMCKTSISADELEKQLIKQYNSQNKLYGYNIAPGGEAPWNRGLPKEQQPMFGKKQSVFQKQRMSEVHTGRQNTHSKKWSEQMSNIMTGRILTNEWKEKISKAQRKFTEKQEQKIVKLRKSGMSVPKLALKFKCTKPTIYNILKRYL